MYDLLRRFLPPWIAEVILVLWYLILIVSILLAIGAPSGEFRYGDL